MRKLFIAAMTMSALCLASAANAGPSERTMSGAAIGAGAVAIVAGPVGAAAGGVVGAVVGGPRISRWKKCWIDRRGSKKCR